MTVEYEFYDGDRDPLLWESELSEHKGDAVECPNGCGYWNGQLIENGACPECGDDCATVEFDEDDEEE